MRSGYAPANNRVSSRVPLLRAASLRTLSPAYYARAGDDIMADEYDEITNAIGVILATPLQAAGPARVLRALLDRNPHIVKETLERHT